MTAKPTSIDEYLARLSQGRRAALEKLRRAIRAAVPQAEECISYQLPAFRLNGRPLVAFGASTNHCSFFPMSATTVNTLKDDLKDYDTSKGTIRFQPDKPLPATLVRKVVQARIAESTAQGSTAQKPPAAAKKRGEKPAGSASRTAPDVGAVVAQLKSLATKAVRDGMARYGIPSDNAFGVSVGTMQKLAKQLGRNHDLAMGLWDTGWYEARMLAAFLDEPNRVSAAQMDRWCGDFDNWAICDTVCFHLFDRTPHAWSKVKQWARRREEFVKRGAFALLWGLTRHDRQCGDDPFVQALSLIERAADDERHYVKKAANMALRAVGRRSPKLHAAAVDVAERLASSTQASARWIGKDALRELIGRRRSG